MGKSKKDWEKDNRLLSYSGEEFGSSVIFPHEVPLSGVRAIIFVNIRKFCKMYQGIVRFRFFFQDLFTTAGHFCIDLRC